jgi:hypothetical protein
MAYKIQKPVGGPGSVSWIKLKTERVEGVRLGLVRSLSVR